MEDKCALAMSTGIDAVFELGRTSVNFGMSVYFGKIGGFTINCKFIFDPFNVFFSGVK
jgi:hypothetical protein